VGAEVDPDLEDERTPSPFAIPNAILRHRGLILAAVAIGMALGLATALGQVPTFEAGARFVVSASARGVGTNEADLGPVQQRDPFDYYTSVLTSTRVVEKVLNTSRGSGSTIRQDLGLPDGGANQELARLRLLGAGVRLESTRRTAGGQSFPVLMVRASWTDPQMAADLANAFLRELAEYDQAIRTDSAEKRLKFIQTQTDVAFQALTDAENALREFREQNRLVRHSTTGVPPLLSTKDDQLSRQVSLRSELYTDLRKALDQVRIAKLDDASAVVVVEPAAPPTSRTGVARRTYMLAGAVFGLLGGLVLTGVLELRRNADMTTPEAQEFAGHLRAIREQVTGLTGNLRDRTTTSSSVDQSAPKHDA